jgi:hypothetical protein
MMLNGSGVLKVADAFPVTPYSGVTGLSSRS